VAEVAHLSMTASRRLQLAAEGSGVIGPALRRWRRQSDATEFRQPTAAMTRRRAAVHASARTACRPPAGGSNLVRCRGGESAEFEVKACDAQGRLALPLSWPAIASRAKVLRGLEPADASGR
jgi:protein ImuA